MLYQYCNFHCHFLTNVLSLKLDTFLDFHPCIHFLIGILFSLNAVQVFLPWKKDQCVMKKHWKMENNLSIFIQQHINFDLVASLPVNATCHMVKALIFMSSCFFICVNYMLVFTELQINCQIARQADVHSIHLIDHSFMRPLLILVFIPTCI